MEESFRKRIGYSGEIKDISVQICKDYNIGDFKSNHLILVGYEDFNFILETSRRKYFVKVFAKFRNMDGCKRYIEIMEKVMDAKISAPKLLKSKQGLLYVTEINKVQLRLCVAEYIDGKTLFELDGKLNNEEIVFLAHQISLINKLEIKPKPIYDEWAITNFLKEFKKKSKSLSVEDRKLVEPLVKKYKELKIEELPHCFVHGDIISTNVIKNNYGKLWIIDFSVSNYYPRIQELAVLACNLFFEENNKEKSKENLEIALKEYQKVITLTKE